MSGKQLQEAARRVPQFAVAAVHSLLTRHRCRIELHWQLPVRRRDGGVIFSYDVELLRESRVVGSLAWELRVCDVDAAAVSRVFSTWRRLVRRLVIADVAARTLGTLTDDARAVCVRNRMRALPPHATDTRACRP